MAALSLLYHSHLPPAEELSPVEELVLPTAPKHKLASVVKPVPASPLEAVAIEKPVPPPSPELVLEPIAQPVTGPTSEHAPEPATEPAPKLEPNLLVSDAVPDPGAA